MAVGKTTPQELSDFFTSVINAIEQLQIPYIVLAKLFVFEQTESDKHLRDAKGVLVTQWGQLDLKLIRRMADRSGVLSIFEQIYEAARREFED